MKKKNIVQLALLASVVVVSSCASKKDLDNCQRENRELNESYRSTREQLAASQARVTSLEEQLAQQKRDYAALQGSLDKSLNNSSANNVNISKLVDQINESNQYIRHLVEVKSKSDSLNMVLTNNLTRSLSREELKEVDVRVLKGVVYISLADNMLYKSGSYEINDRAAETLSKIAKIIMDYQDYDVLVEGNTDNVPINRENIRNNWDLSCLRASSVVQYLQTRYGVNPKRLTAGGRGEFNPVATNGTEVGKQRNRRTQIIITPKLDQFMDLIDKPPERHPMKYFTLLQTLPEGSIYQTDLTPVVQFQDWLDDFEELLRQSLRFTTVCTPMRLDKSPEQRTADRKTYLAWIKAHQPQLAERCAAMLLIEPDAAQLEFFREQSSKLASALGVNYIAEADEVSAMRKAEEALKAI